MSLENAITFALHEPRSTDDIAEAVNNLTNTELKQLKFACKKLLKIVQREEVNREIRALENE